MAGYRVRWRTAGAGRPLWRYASQALAGVTANIVYLGGSITQGTGSVGGTKWQVLAANALDDAYPTSTLTHYNKGVGGTPSWYGCVRLQDDVIAYSPKLVVVDFAVNDADMDTVYWPSAEALIRRLRTALPDTTIVFVDFVRPGDTARFMSRGMWAALCGRYSIPRMEFAQMLNNDAGTILDYAGSAGYFADTVHPNITGHAVAGNAIGRWMRPTATTSASKPWSSTLPSALYSNVADFERTPIIINGSAVPDDGSWSVSGNQKYTNLPNATLTYSGSFSSVGIDTDYGSGEGTMSWRIDGGTWTAIDLGARNHWLNILTYTTYGSHTLEIRCDSGRVGINRVMTI